MSTETDNADACTDFDYDVALFNARQLAQYNHATNDFSAYAAPETTVDDPVIEAVASWVSPSGYVLRAAAESNRLDDDDGAKPGQTAPRAARTFLFDRDDDDDDDLTFRVTDEFSSRYGDKVAVETPAPWDCPDDLKAANDVIKTLDWDDTHRTWDDTRDAWTMDAHAVDDLADLATDAGYDFVDERDADDDDAHDLSPVADFAQDGDRIHVRYAKKNGNGLNTYSGEVRASVIAGSRNHRSRVRTTDTRIVFEDDSHKTKNVHRDDNGNAALYSMGQYPFMGEVVAITVEPAN